MPVEQSRGRLAGRRKPTYQDKSAGALKNKQTNNQGCSITNTQVIFFLTVSTLGELAKTEGKGAAPRYK